MSENINRMNAERDLRQLTVLAAANSSEGFTEKLEGLQSELGRVTKFEEVFDASAMADLLMNM